MEVALESTTLAAGDVLTGSVSLQNLRGKRVRGIDASVVEIETVSLPTFEVREGRRFAIRVHDGSPRRRTHASTLRRARSSSKTS